MSANFALTAETLKSGIAVRSPNWLGDAVMALPAMCCLREMLPESSPFCVISPGNLAPLYDSIPWVSKVIEIESGHSGWSRDKLNDLRKFNAGFGFLFVNSLRSAYYFRRCMPKVFGASNGLRNIFLTKSFAVEWHKNKTYSDEHQSRKYLSMVYALGAKKWNERYPEFKLIDVAQIKASGASDFIAKGKCLAIAPGAAYGTAKRWSSKNYNQVCRYWIESKKGNVIVLGAENENDTANDVIQGLKSGKVLNLVGKTNLKELICILKKSDLCLCNDSGVMHLGSALDIKGIAIFGSTDPYSTGPLSTNWTVIINKQDCSPCFSRQCMNLAKDYKCLTSITADSIIQTIEKMEF